MEWSRIPDAFAVQSHIFNRCLLVDGHRLWVPENFLSVHSPKLQRLFRNAQGTDVCIPNQKVEDVVEMLECLVPCPMLKKVDARNLEVILRVAEEFDIQFLRLEGQKIVDEYLVYTMNEEKEKNGMEAVAGGKVSNVAVWNQQQAKLAALKAVTLSANTNRAPSGPYAHLYEKPIPKFLTTPLHHHTHSGLLTRPGPTPLQSFPTRYDSPRGPAARPPIHPPLTSGLGPNGAPSKAFPLNILCQFGSYGPAQNQFNSPHGFCLSVSNDNIVVADTNNHRVQIFSKTGQFQFEFGTPGREEGYLWYPRKVAVNYVKNDEFVVCDRGNERSRMQIFDKYGNFLRRIAIRFVDIVAGLAVDADGLIIVVDSVSPSIFCINHDTGELDHWFDCSSHMKEPSDIACYNNELYVCDFKGHCVCVFYNSKEGQFLRRIGCDKITSFPNGIDISSMGDVMIGDSHGNRLHLSVFKANGEFEAEFDCPHLKVSRCCGLRITSDGHLITLAKNNHHVLVMDALTIPDMEEMEITPPRASYPFTLLPPLSPHSPPRPLSDLHHPTPPSS